MMLKIISMMDSSKLLLFANTNGKINRINRVGGDDVITIYLNVDTNIT